MASPNTPAARIPRQFTSIPRGAPLPRGGGTGSVPRAAGGHNPLSAGAEKSGPGGPEDVPYQQAPVTGLPSLLLHPLIQGMYDETTDKTNAARKARRDELSQAAEDKQADVQKALDSYQQHVDAAGGNAHQGLINWASSPDGHAAIGKNLMNPVVQLHSALTAPDPNGQPRAFDAGNGLTGLATPDGKYHVFTPKQMESGQPGGKPVKGPGGVYGTWAPGQDGRMNFTPGTVGGQEQAPPQAPVKVTPAALTQQIQDIRTVLESSQKMQANIGATGSMGWGSANRFTAINTPLGGPQAQAYNEAYNQMAPALTRLTKAPGNVKIVAEQALAGLPKPGSATPFILNQQLPGLQLQYREQIASIYEGAKAENRVAAAKQAQVVAQTFDAHPQKMQDIQMAMSKLQTSPATLTPQEVSLLADESARGRVPYDAVVKIHRQMAQMQMIPAEDLPKVAASDPNFRKALDPTELRPDALPPLPRAQMGTGPQPQAPNVPPPINMPGGPGARHPSPQAPVQAQPPGPQGSAADPRQVPMGGQPNRLEQMTQAPPQAPVGPMPAPVQQAAPSFNPIASAQAAEMPAGGAPPMPAGSGVAPQAEVPNTAPSPLAGGGAGKQEVIAQVPPKAPVEPQLTPEQQLLQADIAKAAQIAPDPKSADLIAATHQILRDTQPEQPTQGMQ